MALSPIQLKKHDNRKNSGGWGVGGVGGGGEGVGGDREVRGGR